MSNKRSTKRRIKTLNAPIALNIMNTNLSNSNNSLPSLNRDEFTALSCIESLPFSTIDFICSLLVAFQISCAAIHVTREHSNKSKYLQVRSGGASLLVYWTSNLIFDSFIFVVNILTMCFTFKILFWLFTNKTNMNGSSDDYNNDFSLIASSNRILVYFSFYMIITCLSWSTMAYVWSSLFSFRRPTVNSSGNVSFCFFYSFKKSMSQNKYHQIFSESHLT